MGKYIRHIIAGLLSGGITAGTAISTILQDTALSAISDGQWVSMGIGGFIAMAGGWVTLLTKPEADN